MADSVSETECKLEQFRNYLNLLARLQLSPRFRGKVDLSGIVQQTLLEGHLAQSQLAGQPDERLIAFLRKALANNLRDELRRWTSQARDITKEQSLNDALGRSSVQVGAFLAAEQSSPSQRLVRAERLLQLASAIAQLPADQQLAIELHHLQGWPLAQIAKQVEKTKGAVAALLFRGQTKLRELLREHSEA